jgi:excinuclease ABC subunit A
MTDSIEIRGAREHNLRDVNLTLPRNRLIVFTGVSGSGKSSLAFDTLYVEGQRRYIESLSSYARQFLGQWRKPNVDHLGGLSPSISIEQKTGAANPRSTVGTITEIHDYLRVLFARIGRGHCAECGRPIEAQSREQILAQILAQPKGTRIVLLAPLVRGQKGEFKDFFADMIRRGFIRARVDGQFVRLTDRLSLDRQMRHDIEIVVDRITVDEKIRSRLAEAVESALTLSDGSVLVVLEDKPGGEFLLSARYACVHCHRGYDAPSPQLFSFNSPRGMCPQCDGLGFLHTFDEDRLIPDRSRSFRDGAVELVGRMRDMGRWRRHIFEGVADTAGFSLDTPWEKLPLEARQVLLYGAGERHITYAWRMRGGRVFYHGGTWEGIIPQLMAKYRKSASAMHRAMYEKYMSILPCKACNGARLNPQARYVRVAGRSIVELEAKSVDELAEFFDATLPASLTDVERRIAGEIIKEIRTRLGFLLNVGLHYLTLDRPAPTLAGGEAQRIRLAGQIGSGLVGVLYVLDEPSIGLHPRDNARLLATLRQLADQGNTVIVVEHDEETMRTADYLVDFGPGPGIRGGKVVAQGTLDDILAQPDSLTGQYLAGLQRIEVPEKRRPVDGDSPRAAMKPQVSRARKRRSRP